MTLSTRFAFVALLFSASTAGAQVPASISFDAIPEGSRLASGTNPIELLGDAEVAGQLDTAGEVTTGTGVRFPDGTLQVSAATVGGSATANQGLYANRIADISPPNAYTEICFKNGSTQFDIHSLGEPTTGGNCLPGDTGWIIERFERALGPATWTDARVECLQDGLRLPEPFEWQMACDGAAVFALDSMTDGDREWASNTAIVDTTSGLGAISVPIFGENTCDDATRGKLGTSTNTRDTNVVRCAL